MKASHNKGQRLKSSTKKKNNGTQNVRNLNTLAMLQKTYSLNYSKQVRLHSPTSVRMIDSFLIQNHTASNFDNYFQSMKKRKLQGTSTQGKSFFANGETLISPSKKNDLLYGKVHGRRPAARDGHTGIIVGDMLIVFGGDRHHMPFNDTSILDIKTEMEGKGL